MYETLYRLYHEQKLTIAQLDKAISFGWITEEQKQQIIAS